jgi:predicted N-acetyltransferase YhbS
LPQEARRSRYPVPVILLAKLAVDRTVQGQGAGEILLASALRKAVQAADLLGFYAVEVEAKSPAAEAFYRKHGFRALRDDPLQLVLPIATLRPLVLAHRCCRRCVAARIVLDRLGDGPQRMRQDSRWAPMRAECPDAW